ncbi:MAG TPA: hypothetical protein VFG61_07295 [Gaiellaceae bacterium]|jgi:hypothetical protein|nr:hypothetical protein [Gaiellaceae bacterium]
MPETGTPVSLEDEKAPALAEEGGSEEGVTGSGNGNGSVDRMSAAGMFADLVRTHHDVEEHPNETGARERYHHTLEQFEAFEGEITHVYWTSRCASAVALTVKRRGRFAQWVLDDDAVIRLHRLTDWLEPDYRIAELLHHCDTLAIKVSQVLRGTSERIAMQWIYAVQSHLVAYLDRSDNGRKGNGAHRETNKKELNAVIRSQARELIQIEKYYSQAAEKASRIVYFWGMMVGAFLSGLIGLGIAAILQNGGWFDEPHTLSTQTFIICYAAGGLGAIVSVLMRMSSNRFGVDYEVGRATVRRLGSFRPFIGAVFGMALYFLFQSELLHTSVPDDPGTSFFFFGILAFLAGFNERFTNVLLGKAEKTLATSLGDIRKDVLTDEEEE